MAAAEDFPGDPGITAPYTHVADVTTHDTNELAHVTRGIMVTAAGTVVVVTAGGETVTLTLLAATIYPIRVRIIKTASTATGIKALW